MQTIEADCRSGDEISDYLSTALKGWGIWVSNKVKERIILQMMRERTGCLIQQPTNGSEG